MLQKCRQAENGFLVTYYDSGANAIEVNELEGRNMIWEFTRDIFSMY